MAGILNKMVIGRIGVNFSSEAIIRKSKKERNEYLATLKDELSQVLEKFRCSSNIIDAWFVELYEHEETKEQ